MCELSTRVRSGFSQNVYVRTVENFILTDGYPTSMILKGLSLYKAFLQPK